MALKKSEKLKNRNAFRNIHKLKVLSKNEHFKLVAKKQFDVNRKVFPKLAFVVSRKKLKLAVKRNRVKRRIEEAYRTIKESLRPVIFEYEYFIIFLEASILELNFEELKELIYRSLQKK